MTDISRSQAWLESLRPKTLPLAFAAIIVGTVLAWEQGHFDPWVALLALITAGLLQILSNLANDYGDAVKGSDKPDRIGPLRGMQKGVITPQQMKRALIVTVVLICLFGLALLCAAWQSVGDFIGFLALGGLSIVAAITYTVGTRPYGYIGLGDISVLVFFGWLSVLGSWYLQAHNVEAAIFLPATACGLLATAVLNINNLRDIDSDRQNGKNTLAVRPARSMPAAIMPACCSAPCCVWRCLTCWRCIQPGGWLFILATPLLVKRRATSCANPIRWRCGQCSKRRSKGLY